MVEQEIISALDSEPLPPEAAQEIAFDLAKHAGFNDALSLQLTNDYREGRLSSGDLTPAADAVSEKRLDTDLPCYERSKWYLLGCLIPTGTQLDGYFAEFIFGWASDVGISQQTIEAIFRARMPDRRV